MVIHGWRKGNKLVVEKWELHLLVFGKMGIRVKIFNMVLNSLRGKI